MSFTKENVFLLPIREYSKFDSLKSILFGIILFGLIEILHPFIKSNQNFSISFRLFFFISLMIGIIIYELFKRIYQSIEIDYEKKEIIIFYITWFKASNSFSVPFEKLSHTYKIIPSRSFNKNWTLKIWNEDLIVLSLSRGRNGFEKEKLDLFAQKLDEIVNEFQ
jgi:hypothetical protein